MEIPFNEDGFLKVLEGSRTIAMRPDECAICGQIPDTAQAPLSLAEGADGYPAAFSRLKEYIGLKAAARIYRCPVCNRLYSEVYSKGEGGEINTLSRIDHAGALELLRASRGRFFVWENKMWSVI